MKIVHICPTYFSPESVLAGAERYSYELARAMAKKAKTTLITFGKRDFVHEEDGLTVRCFKAGLFIKKNKANPFSLRYLVELSQTDIIHCHQFMTLSTDLAILVGSLFRKKLFVTDLGGNTDFSFSYHLPLWKGIRCFLFVSKYYCERYRKLGVPARVIYGGVDPSLFSPGNGKKSVKLLHVGRIMPHKGIHDLIQALPRGVALDIVGSVEEASYHHELQRRAEGKKVQFYTNLPDRELIQKYREALVTVLPPTEDSGYTTVLESFACETPVIVSSTGSLPEIVDKGVTGFVVPPRDPGAIGERIEYFLSHPDVAVEMGKLGREQVLERFTWDAVADQYLEAYQS